MKKIIALLILSTLIFAGCTKKDTPKNDVPNDNAQATETPSPDGEVKESHAAESFEMMGTYRSDDWTEVKEKSLLKIVSPGLSVQSPFSEYPAETKKETYVKNMSDEDFYGVGRDMTGFFVLDKIERFCQMETETPDTYGIRHGLQPITVADYYAKKKDFVKVDAVKEFVDMKTDTEIVSKHTAYVSGGQVVEIEYVDGGVNQHMVLFFLSDSNGNLKFQSYLGDFSFEYAFVYDYNNDGVGDLFLTERPDTQPRDDTDLRSKDAVEKITGGKCCMFLSMNGQPDYAYAGMLSFDGSEHAPFACKTCFDKILNEQVDLDGLNTPAATENYFAAYRDYGKRYRIDYGRAYYGGGSSTKYLPPLDEYLN